MTRASGCQVNCLLTNCRSQRYRTSLSSLHFGLNPENSNFTNSFYSANFKQNRSNNTEPPETIPFNKDEGAIPVASLTCKANRA